MDADASTHKDGGAFTHGMQEPNKVVAVSTYSMEEPKKGAGASTYSVKEPNKNVGDSTCGMEEPNKGAGASTYSVKEPNKNVGASAYGMKEPTKGASASTYGMKEPTKGAGASTYCMEEPKLNARTFTNSMEKAKTDAYHSTYRNKEPNVDAGASSYRMKERNMNANTSTYDREKSNADAYDSTYGNKKPNIDAYDTYGNEEPYMDAYGSAYEQPYADAYDSRYGNEEPYMDTYDSSYGNEDPYMDTYDSTYGNEEPYTDAYDSYSNEGPNRGAYDSAYGNEQPYVNTDPNDRGYSTNMDGDASGTGETKKGRGLQCSMCCYFTPTQHGLVQHYKSALHKYISGLDRKRRTFVKNLKTLDEVIEACGETEPLIGLEYIYQYAPSKNGIVMYGCKLCQSVYQLDWAYLHIVSPKHRIAYLSKHHPEKEISIDFMLKVASDYDHLHDCAQSVEQTFGRKRIKYLDFYYSQKDPIGEPNGPPVTSNPSQRYNAQNYPQSTPGEEWHGADHPNKGYMDQGGDMSSRNYGKGEDGQKCKRFSRRNRFSFPTEEPVPQADSANAGWGNSSDFPENSKGASQLHFQNRQGLQSGRGNVNNQIGRPNQDNRNAPGRLGNQSNDFPSGRRPSRFDNGQGPGNQDHFTNGGDRQGNRNQFSRNDHRDQNNAPRDGRSRQGDRDNSRLDRRAKSPVDHRRASDNDDRLSQNVGPRDRLNRQGDNGARDYEQDERQRMDDRFSRNRLEDRDDGKHSRRTWNQDGDRPGNHGYYSEREQRHGDQPGSEACDETEVEDPDRLYVLSTFGENVTFLELKKAFKAGLIMNNNKCQKEAVMDEDDMDACSMDLSEEDEGGFLFNQELFEFLNIFRIRSEEDERFVIKARELLSSSLKNFAIQQSTGSMDETSSEFASDATGYNQGPSSGPVEDYFSYNRDEQDYEDDGWPQPYPFSRHRAQFGGRAATMMMDDEDLEEECL